MNHPSTSFKRPRALFPEVDRRRVCPAEDDADPLAFSRLVSPREQCRERCRGSGLGDDAQGLPEAALSGADGLIADQQHMLDVSLRERKHELAHFLRSQRIGRDASRFRLDRMTRFRVRA